mmetsp:Transcript_4684/g.8614  ORF Transcript_4684/g.8614 Transcript_4684/m.8614 type:complete len:344 (+) Transcript_4684:2671-3702(+)
MMAWVLQLQEGADDTETLFFERFCHKPQLHPRRSPEIDSHCERHHLRFVHAPSQILLPRCVLLVFEESSKEFSDKFCVHICEHFHGKYMEIAGTQLPAGPQYIPRSSRRVFNALAITQGSCNRLCKLWGFSNGSVHHVACCWVHKVVGGSIANRAVANQGQRATQWNNTLLYIIHLLDLDAFLLHSHLQACLQVLHCDCWPRHKRSVFHKDVGFIRGHGIQKCWGLVISFLVVPQVIVSPVHQQHFVHWESMWPFRLNLLSICHLIGGGPTCAVVPAPRRPWHGLTTCSCLLCLTLVRRLGQQRAPILRHPLTVAVGVVAARGLVLEQWGVVARRNNWHLAQH